MYASNLFRVWQQTDQMCSFSIIYNPSPQATSSFFTISTVTAWCECVCIMLSKHTRDGYVMTTRQDAAMTAKKQILPFFYPQTNKGCWKENFIFQGKRSGNIHFEVYSQFFCGIFTFSCKNAFLKCVGWYEKICKMLLWNVQENS